MRHPCSISSLPTKFLTSDALDAFECHLDETPDLHLRWSFPSGAATFMGRLRRVRGGNERGRFVVGRRLAPRRNEGSPDEHVLVWASLTISDPEGARTLNPQIDSLMR